MSKYIKLEDAINKLDGWYCEQYTPIELISDLPTIEVSEDCISREWVKSVCEFMLDEEMLGHMLGYIEDAPSVAPSRAEGKAIDRYDDEGWICSNCGKGLYAPDDNYCPNCGEKMKG